MRLMVSGSRHLKDRALVQSVLTSIAMTTDEHVTLIHGACEGLDELAGQVADEMGWGVVAFPANWKRHGFQKAGPIRNALMVASHPDVLYAFPGKCSKGTWDAVRKARDARVPVVIVRTV